MPAHAQPVVVEPRRGPGAADQQHARARLAGIGHDADARSRPTSPARRKVIQSSMLVPMSATAVTPWRDEQLLRLVQRDVAIVRRAAAGSCDATRSIAASTKHARGRGRPAARLDAAPARDRRWRRCTAGDLRARGCWPSRHGRRPARATPGGRQPRRRARRRSGSGRGPIAPGSSRGRRSTAGRGWPRHSRRSCACASASERVSDRSTRRAGRGRAP